MKKIFVIFVSIFVSALFVFAVGCTTNNDQTLANEIDVSVKNFIRTISNLDWPSSSDIDKFDELNSQIENGSLNISEIDTEEIYESNAELKSKINVLMSIRSDLDSATNELVSGNVNLTEENYLSIKVYLDIIKDNSNYLTNYVGIIKNQIAEANELINAQRNLNIVNAYAIKIVETLSIRSSKVDTTILAMNSIVDIINNNLLNNIYRNNTFNIENNYIQEDASKNEYNSGQTQQEQSNVIEPQNDTESDNENNENDGSNLAIVIEPDNVRETFVDKQNDAESDTQIDTSGEQIVKTENNDNFEITRQTIIEDNNIEKPQIYD